MRNLVFGGEEFEGHDIVKPYGVAVYDGAIYAVDSEQGGYVVFDVARGKTRLIQGSGGGGLRKPVNIKIDTDGTRYVTDTERNAVIVFDKNDRYVRTFGQPGQFKPVDIAISGNRLYVSDVSNMRVHVLNKNTGETEFAFGEAGSGQGKLFHPTSLAIGPDETLYVTNTGNFRIDHFTLDGSFIRSIGKIGTSAGKFARPKGIAVDREGQIYAVDSAFENVQVLAEDGTPLTVIGSGGNQGQFVMPAAVTIDYENVEHFQQYAAPGFELDYLVVVSSQFGGNKIAVFGYGSMSGDFVGANEGER
jgi:DNA-binding beta-propeller fold protein YncE